MLEHPDMAQDIKYPKPRIKLFDSPQDNRGIGHAMCPEPHETAQHILEARLNAHDRLTVSRQLNGGHPFATAQLQNRFSTGTR